MLNFLEPLQFPSESTFLEEFGDLKTDEQVCLKGTRAGAIKHCPSSRLDGGATTFHSIKDINVFFLLCVPTGEKASGHFEAHDVEEAERRRREEPGT